MRSKMLTAALCVLVLGSAATRVDAGWCGANGVACVPGDPAIQAHRYTIGAGSVKHQVGASGLITLYCAVNPGLGGLAYTFDPDWGPIFYPCGVAPRYLMRQTYTDSDATGTAVYVRSTLQRTSKGNGAISPVAGAMVHSNAYPDTVSTNHWGRSTTGSTSRITTTTFAWTWTVSRAPPRARSSTASPSSAAEAVPGPGS